MFWHKRYTICYSGISVCNAMQCELACMGNRDVDSHKPQPLCQRSTTPTYENKKGIYLYARSQYYHFRFGFRLMNGSASFFLRIIGGGGRTPFGLGGGGLRGA